MRGFRLKRGMIYNFIIDCLFDQYVSGVANVSSIGLFSTFSSICVFREARDIVASKEVRITN